MKRTSFFILAVLLFFVGITLSGCGKSVSEKAVEKAIEKSTNGQANVDFDDKTVKVDTKEGSWETGEEVSLPSGFPEDVYIIDGKIKVAATVKENEAYNVSIWIDKSVTEAKAIYEKELVADGWVINFNATYGAIATLAAEKGDRQVNVAIADMEQGQVQVTISVSKK